MREEEPIPCQISSSHRHLVMAAILVVDRVELKVTQSPLSKGPRSKGIPWK